MAARSAALCFVVQAFGEILGNGLFLRFGSIRIDPRELFEAEVRLHPTFHTCHRTGLRSVFGEEGLRPQKGHVGVKPKPYRNSNGY